MIKTFEVVLRIEVETPGKTEPTKADAYDIVAEACALYKAPLTVSDTPAVLNDVRIDSVVETDDFTDIYDLA